MAIIDTSKISIPIGFFEDLNVPKLFKWLYEQPTADVVPRDEVRRIFEEIEKIINKPFTAGFDVLSPPNQALREYNNDIRKEMLYYVAQLEEEYTKGGRVE